jgi:Leucine-rich repeat (LRR) protein
MFDKKYEITIGEYGLHLCMFSAWSESIEKKAKRKKISELELNHAKGWPRGSDLSFLENLTQLKYFELLDHWVSDVSVINKLSELKELNITSNCNNVIDCSNFPHLERIGLEWFSNAKSLFDCVTLKRVFINCCDIKDLSVFSKLQNLEYLSLKSPKIASIGNVNTLTKLKFLGIYNIPILSSLEGVEQFPNLEMLEVERCRKISNITPVKALKKLQRLMIANCGKIDSLKPAAELTELREVFFHESTNILDGDLMVLKKLPHLKDVSFQERRHYNCKWDDLPMRCSKKELQKARELLKKK